MRTLVDCGCETKVHPDGSGVEVYFCPLHEAAPELLEALRACNNELIGHAAYLETCDGGVVLDNMENTVRHLRQVQQQAEAAIRKAKGE